MTTRDARRTYNLALTYYLMARKAGVGREHHLLALLLASVWVATERTFGDPWREGVVGCPAMTREHFVRTAGEAYDQWMHQRPGPTFVVIDGGADDDE